MAAKMTQSQMVKELAAAVGVPNKVGEVVHDRLRRAGGA